MRAMSKKKSKSPSNTIAQNKKARHDYHLSDNIEAGIVLDGWEVKAIRAGSGQIVDSYVIFKNNEAYLLGSFISPVNTTSTHVLPDPTRTRKLLLNRRELDRLMNAVEQKGRACICTSLYWKNHLVKAEIALGVGKKDHDKRQSEKEKDWNREKQRTLRTDNR
jgi:SsrA-binding protein